VADPGGAGMGMGPIDHELAHGRGELAPVTVHLPLTGPGQAARANGGPPAAPNGLPVLSRFVVDGHSFIAIAQASNGRGRGNAPPGFRPGALAVGRITCLGRRYLVYDAEQAPMGDAGPSPAEILTRRELQIAMLIADGNCDKEIARHLGISGYTVREHIRRIFAKLNIGRRSAIVACVLR
jgi:DNA-binding CsgD family transcriptional regulator